MPKGNNLTTKRDAISVATAAELLGVCKKTLYVYIHSGELPTFKLGRRRLIRRKSLDEFLQQLERKQLSANRFITK